MFVPRFRRNEDAQGRGDWVLPPGCHVESDGGKLPAPLRLLVADPPLVRGVLSRALPQNPRATDVGLVIVLSLATGLSRLTHHNSSL